MKTALITGANGFIGTNLIKRLLKENIKIFALISDSENLNEEINNPLVSLINCNLEKAIPDDINIPQQIDILYHFAWIGVQPEQRRDFNLQLRNINITLNSLIIAKEKKIKRFVMPGSTNEYLYSGKVINGECLPSPKDDYGALKVAIYYIAKQFADDNGIDFFYTILSGIYSEKRNDNNVISYTVQKLLNNEKPSLTKLEQLWDYVHIDDVVEALLLIGEKGKKDKVYIVGHGDNWPLRKYIEIISKKINPSLPLGIGEVPYSSNIIPMSCVDLTDLKKDTGFEPKISFEEGISRMIDALKN